MAVGRRRGRKGLSFISNRQRRKEGTFCVLELQGIEPMPSAPERAEYVRLDHSATVEDEMYCCGGRNAKRADCCRSVARRFAAVLMSYVIG